ncbi:MAG: hypothetical protein NZ551_04680 [Microscillaceae bacterium]|nr:hypothetical protein [Microscillaceae bacterium]MDW8460488.1 hypothetical protein [Cytophagales bacterium]
MKRYLYQLLGWLGILSLTYCQMNDEQPCEVSQKIQNISLRVSIKEVEKELFKQKDVAGILAILRKYPDLSQALQKFGNLRNDSTVAEQFLKLIQAKGINELYQDVSSKFGSVEKLEREFELAFKHIKYYYPDFVPPKIYTLITGFGYDLIANDKIILIGKEFFLGDKGKFPLPPQIPLYQMRRYKPEYIVANSLQYLSEKYNRIDEKDRTVLAEMIYFGKAYYFTKTMMPCLPDSILFGYTQTELANIQDEDNRKYIWAHFVERKLLFSTSHFHIQSYLNERPYVAEINKKCPGRIGRWLGLRILEKYAQKKRATLQEIMREANAREIFTQSAYKGD